MSCKVTKQGFSLIGFTFVHTLAVTYDGCLVVRRYPLLTALHGCTRVADHSIAAALQASKQRRNKQAMKNAGKRCYYRVLMIRNASKQ